MSTDRSARPRRRRSEGVSYDAPEPALSAQMAVENVTARNDAHGQAEVLAEPQALVEAELALGDELDAGGKLTTSPSESSEAVSAIAYCLDGLLVFSIPVRILYWPIRGAWWLGPILTGALPLILNGALTLIYSRIALHTAAAWGWLTIFAVTQTGALLAARVLWGRLVRDMPIIAMMLPDEPSERKFATWINSWCSAKLQMVAGFALGGLGAFVLWLASPTVGQHLELGLVSYITVAWTSFMGGLILYAFVMATLITYEIGNCGLLILDQWDPANTPGLRTLSRGYIYCLCLLILIAAGLEIVATRVPDYQASYVLGAFVVGFPIFAVACGLFVSILPHITIERLTYASKMKTRALIDEEIGDVRASMAADHGRLVTLIWLRNQVVAAPGLPVRAPWLVPLMAALLGPLVAFLLALKR